MFIIKLWTAFFLGVPLRWMKPFFAAASVLGRSPAVALLPLFFHRQLLISQASGLMPFITFVVSIPFFPFTFPLPPPPPPSARRASLLWSILQSYTSEKFCFLLPFVVLRSYTIIIIIRRAGQQADLPKTGGQQQPCRWFIERVELAFAI